MTPLAMVIVSAPSGAFRGDDQLGIERAILWAELAVVWAVGLWLLYDASRALRSGRRTPVPAAGFVRLYPALYLGVHVALWAVALPAYLGATDGVTAEGTPTGSLWYVVLCILAASALVAATLRATTAQENRVRETVKA